MAPKSPPPYRRSAAAAGDAIPFAHDGSLHLFHLASPPGTLDYPERVRTTWRHLVSDDLVTWRALPDAIAPGPPGSCDAGGIWTGSLVEHDGEYYLFYTGHDPQSARPQSICLATSQDLITFDRVPENPLLLPVAGYEDVDWRDPYVFWNEAEGVWWMLIAARRAEGPGWHRGCIVLATSADLRTWTVEPEPLYEPGVTYCPECPELWPGEDGLWYLVFSRFSESVGTIYRVADSPRGPFRTPAREALGGRRWYAAKSAPWAGGRAFFGWVHDVTTDPRRWLWGGDMALPRLVAPATAGPAGTLVVRPAPGILTEPGEALSRADGSVVAADVDAGDGCRAVDLGSGAPASCVVHLGIEVPGAGGAVGAGAVDAGAAAVGLDLLGAADAGLRLTVDLRRRRVVLTAEPQPLDDFWADLTRGAGRYREVEGPELAAADLLPAADSGSALELRVLLDGDVVEVYVADDVALSYRYPRAAWQRAAAFVRDGRARLRVAVEDTGWPAAVRPAAVRPAAVRPTR